MAVKREIVLNGLGQISTRVVRIAEQLLMVPIFLSFWGADYYGEWLTISIIPSVLAFSDMGFGTAVSNSFVLSYSKNEKQVAADNYATGVVIITLTILLGVLLSFFVVAGAWKMGFLEKSVIPVYDVIWALVFLMSSRLVSFYTQLFEGFFRAKHKAATAYNLHAIDGILRIIVGIITLLLGCSVVGYSIGQFVIGTLFIIGFIFLSFHFVRDLPKGHFNKPIAINSLKIGLGFLLTPVWQSIYLQGATFAVRIVLGPTAVAVFNTVRTVCQSVHALFSIVNGSIYPEIQIAYGKGNNTLVRNIYTNAMQLVFIAAVAGLAFLLLFGQTLYSWWTNNELQVSNSVWYIFMLGIPLNALWWTAGTVFRALNKPARFSIIGLVSATISALLALILAYPFGLAGAAFGFISMDIIMLILIVPMANTEIGMDLKNLFNFEMLKNGITKIFK